MYEFVPLCENLLVAIWEKDEEEEERFKVADRAVCHSVPSSLQKQISLRAIFHPQGILLALVAV